MNTIYKTFFLLTLSAMLLFIIVFVKDLYFQNNPLSQETMEKLKQKHLLIRELTHQRYGTDVRFPIIIEDHLPNNLFGLTGYKKGMIKIFLNKKRFQENEKYMVEYVLPHEYAHALMFYFGDFTQTNGGHTKRWQSICKNIGGIKCDRFVDHNDILIEKLGGIY
jgi:SprT protein